MDYISFILGLGLFFPQLALIIGYFSNGILPNPFPFWLDFILAVFIPRILFLIYIALNWNTLNNTLLWFILHLIFFILSILYRVYKSNNES
jgi:hypothetical protein